MLPVITGRTGILPVLPLYGGSLGRGPDRGSHPRPPLPDTLPGLIMAFFVGYLVIIKSVFEKIVHPNLIGNDQRDKS